jgi:hypothetical protein
VSDFYYQILNLNKKKNRINRNYWRSIWK